MRIAASIFGLLFLGLRIASAADELFLSQDGRVSPATGDEWRITPAIWGNGGKLWGSIIGKTAPMERPCPSADFEFLFKMQTPFARGRVRLEPLAADKIRVVFSHNVFGGAIRNGGLGGAIEFTASSSNFTWSVNGCESRAFQEDPRFGADFCRPVKVSELAFGVGTGTLRLAFSESAFCQYRGPRQGSASYVFRFGRAANVSLPQGTEEEFSVVLSLDGARTFTPRITKPLVIRAGDEWIPFNYRKDIVAGSAADFSSVSCLDAPAGKYGWLKRDGGRFVFERRPGVPVRFWGANLTGDACFPKTPEAAARLADRLARIGYNSIRIHHHDWRCSRGYAETGELNSDGMDRLDRLLAECFKRGIYATTDLYVSRGAPWKSIGEEHRKGSVGRNHFKAYVLFHEGAYSNYCDFAAKFLQHVNPYTGRAYKDEPALNLISLVNEGLFFATWRTIVKEPSLRRAWKEWLDAERAKDPGCFPGFKADDPPEGEYRQKVTEGPRADVLTAFSVHMELRFFKRMSDFLRGVGCKALLTDVNFGPSRSGMREMRHAFDYVDTHFYYEHPVKRGNGVRYGANRHPFRVEPGLVFEKKRFADRPFTVSEYNWCAPCQYRAIGSLLGACVAAGRDWSGVWRFAYSQGGRNLEDGSGVLGAYDAATDPIILGMERAAAAIYLRGDLAVSENTDGSPSLADMDIKGMSMDFSTEALTVDTPCTAGGYAPEDVEITTSALRLRCTGSAAAVWATSLDGKPLRRSGRITLFHLTDALGDGATFTDFTRREITARGQGVLMRRGVALVSLMLERPDEYDVYALDAVGNRIERLKTEVSQGGLRFTADIRGVHGARNQYEIVRR